MKDIKAKTEIIKRPVFFCKKSIPYVTAIDSFDVSYFTLVFIQVFSLGTEQTEKIYCERIFLKRITETLSGSLHDFPNALGGTSRTH